MAYTITEHPFGITVEGPLPLEDLQPLTQDWSLRGFTIADGVISEHLGVTMAVTSPTGRVHWRRSLCLYAYLPEVDQAFMVADVALIRIDGEVRESPDPVGTIFRARRLVVPPTPEEEEHEAFWEENDWMGFAFVHGRISENAEWASVPTITGQGFTLEEFLGAPPKDEFQRNSGLLALAAQTWARNRSGLDLTGEL